MSNKQNEFPAQDKRRGAQRRTGAGDMRSDSPHLSAYFERLGEDAAKISDERRGDRRKATPSYDPHAEHRKHNSHPIGDRRAPEVHVSTEDEASAVPRFSWSLGVWGYYFIVKLAMFGMGTIGFHPLENAAFAAFVLLPAGPYRRIKGVATFMLAVALLYYDSWLPGMDRLLSRMALLSDFRVAYLFELMTRLVSFTAIVSLCTICIVYWLLPSRARAGSLILSGAVLWGVQNHVLHDAGRVFQPEGAVPEKAQPNMDKVVQDFFDTEALRSVELTKPAPDALPFDVIFIHVCSLSWDDVHAAGLDQHPLWNRFDILMTKFNSATSYSGPAAIHLLRATCGQQTHDKMYLPVPDKCYLMSSLKNSGFETNFALNHNGKFDGYLDQVRTHGHLDAPLMDLSGLTTRQYSFIESPVYDDLTVLNRWLSNREKSDSARVALYYNSASLHDGNHAADAEALPNTLKTYGARLGRFLDDMDGFLDSLEKSGRRAVVVMVPEHGGAVRGDMRQVAGLREIPTPAITLVPVGIKVVGGKAVGSNLTVDKPTSFLAISHIVERMLEKSPYGTNGFLPSDYIADLPVTPLVSQNEKVSIMGYDGRYYYTRGFGSWEDYTEFNQPVNGE